MSPGHSYRFRVRAVDRAGLWSGWRYGPVLGVGVLVRTVDLYTSTVQPARIVFTRSWASTATHKVTVRVAGTSGRPRLEVDAFVLLR